eukprot:6685282-Pyramimonas_sp.AAC.1
MPVEKPRRPMIYSPSIGTAPSATRQGQPRHIELTGWGRKMRKEVHSDRMCRAIPEDPVNCVTVCGRRGRSESATLRCLGLNHAQDMSFLAWCKPNSAWKCAC